MLVGLLRKRYGLRGAWAFVRRYGIEAVNLGIEDYELAEVELAGQGFKAEIRSPGGFLVWLVRQRQEVSCGDD